MGGRLRRRNLSTAHHRRAFVFPREQTEILGLHNEIFWTLCGPRRWQVESVCELLLRLYPNLEFLALCFLLPGWRSPGRGEGLVCHAQAENLFLRLLSQGGGRTKACNPSWMERCVVRMEEGIYRCTSDTYGLFMPWTLPSLPTWEVTGRTCTVVSTALICHGSSDTYGQFTLLDSTPS